MAALLAAGCAAFDPYNVLTRHLPREATPVAPVPLPPAPALGEAGRLAAYDFVWTTVNERYYDPAFNGVDWNAAGERWKPRVLAAPTDEAFWEELDRMTGELHDSHTRVESPKRAELIARFESVSLGFGFRPIGGRLVVTNVHPESDAWWAGLRPGMTLERVGDAPAREAYAKFLADAREGSTPYAKHLTAVRLLTAGEPESTATLTFARGDGTSFTASLKRKRFASPPRVVSRLLPSGFGYIRLTSWAREIEGRLMEAIETLKSAPGFVIDLRGNPGGSALMVRNAAARFFEGNVEFGRSLTRTGKPITVAFDWIELIALRQEFTGTGTYLGPVVVLVNGESGSGSELFAGILQTQGRAKVAGTTTCGCLLAFMGYAQVPGGGRLAYSEVGFVFPGGKKVEGEGIVPDDPVELSAADLLVDRDRALERAQAILATMPPWKAAQPPASAAAR